MFANRLPLSLVASAVIFATPATLVADPPLALSLAADTVTVEKLTPGATLVYFSVARDSEGYIPRTERWERILADDDSDGIVTFELHRPAPVKYVGVAIELESGRFDTVTPEGSPAHAVAFPSQSLTGPGNRLTQIESGDRYAELLLLRPGVGVWAGTVGDGGATDSGTGGDGLILMDIANMYPVGDSGPPPEEFERDDILVKVAPLTAEYYAIRIVR